MHWQLPGFAGMGLSHFGITVTLGHMSGSPSAKNRKAAKSTRTVGRGRPVVLPDSPTLPVYEDATVKLYLGDSLDHYRSWPSPTAIVSDGAYGVLGFEGDTSDHLELPRWYEPHIAAWSAMATPATTLWFWNSEIGWAAVHPILEKYGWRYVSCNVWDKGRGHIAGNVNTSTIRRFPVVTEVCVQYVYEARIDGMPLKKWLLTEWMRSGLPLYKANEACGVRNAATRKYLDQGHLWYFPPPEMFQRLVDYANIHGREGDKPYFSVDGKRPLTAMQWGNMRSKFRCPHGVTNVWSVPPLRNGERVKTPSGRAIHLNQKPLELMSLIVAASTDTDDVVWEPFGGLFSASLAAKKLGRRAFGAEIDPTYFQFGIARFRQPGLQDQFL